MDIEDNLTGRWPYTMVHIVSSPEPFCTFVFPSVLPEQKRALVMSNLQNITFS